MENFLLEVKRVQTELIITVALLALFATGGYVNMSAPLQMILMKMVLTSMGFVHSHIIRKIAFPKVDWNSSEAPYNKVLIIVLTAVFVISYAIGG